MRCCCKTQRKRINRIDGDYVSVTGESRSMILTDMRCEARMMDAVALVIKATSSNYVALLTSAPLDFPKVKPADE